MMDADGWNERKEEIMKNLENRQHLHPETRNIMEEIRKLGGYRVRGQAPIPPKSAMSGRPPKQRPRASAVLSAEVQDVLAGVVLKDSSEQRLAGNEQDFSSIKLELGKVSSTTSLKPRGTLRAYFPAASRAASLQAKAHHPPRLSGSLTAR